GSALDVTSNDLAHSAVQTPAPSSPLPGAPTSAHTEELFDFLAPAEEAGEIGRLGGYRVRRLLGQGGMGMVFLAEDPQLRRCIALKAMRQVVARQQTSRDRFLREARAMAAVRHDHVVTIHQVGEDRGIPFLAMELLEGETLEDRLRRPGRLSLPE